MTAGRWVSVDGVEGAGKTTLVRELRDRFPAALVVAEFSEGVVGRLLTEAVKENPHHISSSPMGQSLLFLAEFRARYDETIVPELSDGRLIFHDRGYLSKYAYQHAVMEPSFGTQAGDLLRSLFSHIPRPTLTVVLTAPLRVIRDRLVERDGVCDDERLEFVARADVVFRDPPIELPEVAEFDTSTREPSAIAANVAALLDSMNPA